MWFTSVRLAEISHYVLKNIRQIARKPNSKNQPWINTHGLMIIAIDNHKFSRKMRESIEIEKHSTIDQEGKPLDSTWRALLLWQTDFSFFFAHT